MRRWASSVACLKQDTRMASIVGQSNLPPTQQGHYLEAAAAAEGVHLAPKPERVRVHHDKQADSALRLRDKLRIAQHFGTSQKRSPPRSTYNKKSESSISELIKAFLETPIATPFPPPQPRPLSPPPAPKLPPLPKLHVDRSQHSRSSKYALEEMPIFNAGDVKLNALGRTLCRVLRHQAVNMNLDVREDGYCRVDQLLNLDIYTHAGVAMMDHTVEDMIRVVNEDPKQRFSKMIDENGQLHVRANQGHSMKVVLSEKLLKEIIYPDEIPMCVHGTFLDVLPSIMNIGLSCMRRNHVHFAMGLPNDEGVISGMSKACEVIIYLNVTKALEDGMKLYISDNKVLLSEGFGGIIPNDYFDKVVEWPSHQHLYIRERPSQ